MRNLNLRTRLMIAFAIPFGLLLIIAFVGVSMNNQITDAYSEVTQRNLPIVRALEEIKFAGSRIISSTNELVLDELLALNAEESDRSDEEDAAENGEIDETKEAIAQYQEAFASYLQLIDDEPEDGAIRDAIDTSGQTLVTISTNLMALQEEGASVSELLEARIEFEDAEAIFLAAIAEAVDFETVELAASQSNVNAAMDNLTVFMVALVIVSVVATSIAGALVIRSIMQPLNTLKAASDQLRAGDLKARTHLKTRDEIGQVAQSFDLMAEKLSQNIVDLEQREREALEARAQAERSDQVKSAFLASMSHELRTPLNSVINFTKFVVRGVMGPVNEKQEETLTKVINSGQHLLTLINDVLDMSKIESGSLNLFIEDDLELAEILGTSVGYTEGLLAADGRPVDLQVDIEAGIPRIRGDRKRLTQIMLNVLSNACKFTEQGYIRLKAYVENDEVVISVKDTGMGIAPEDHAGVFEPFKQTASGLRQGGGTGLGMPITRSLVEAHGGRLWFESEVKLGTTFYIVLPVKSELLVPTRV